MQHYPFSNIEINNQFISANLYKENNYIFKIGAQALQLKHSKDIENILYKSTFTNSQIGSYDLIKIVL